tara:strand:- start:220 stop:486 length:267 start_codon:yes stop_codon:yes gene_type:complete
MKFELKTENEKYSNLFTHFFKTISILTLIVILCDIALKLGVISKQYQIEYNCKHLSVEKSSSNFKKLSSLTNLKSKQRIWELCKETFN